MKHIAIVLQCVVLHFEVLRVSFTGENVLEEELSDHLQDVWRPEGVLIRICDDICVLCDHHLHHHHHHHPSPHLLQR